MYKEFITILIVIVLIVIGNIITQNNTNYTVEKMNNNLYSLRSETIKEKVNQKMLKEKINQIENDWKQEYEKLAYYIEHDELEKVESELTKLKADIEMKEYDMALENLDNCVFILNHIKDKSAFKILNIF